MANGAADFGQSTIGFVISALSYVPFRFNRKAALDFTRKPIIRALIISAVFLALWGLVFATLALPLVFSLLGLLAMAELRLLYPEPAPAPGSRQYYLCLCLSRRRPVPADQAPVPQCNGITLSGGEV